LSDSDRRGSYLRSNNAQTALKFIKAMKKCQW